MWGKICIKSKSPRTANRPWASIVSGALSDEPSFAYSAAVASKLRGIGCVATLLRKRQEFEHESEVRLLYMDPTNSMRSQQVLPVNCVPSELIQEMLLDPRSTISEATTVRRRIQCLGYRKKVTQSKLYQTP